MKWLTTTTNKKDRKAESSNTRNLWKSIVRLKDSIWNFKKGYRNYE